MCIRYPHARTFGKARGIPCIFTAIRPDCIEEAPIYMLLKFGTDRTHLEALRGGLLYMRPLDYFAKLEESEAGRGDSFEGVTTIIQPRHIGELIIDTVNAGLGRITAKPMEDLAGPVKIRLRKRGHATCTAWWL